MLGNTCKHLPVQNFKKEDYHTWKAYPNENASCEFKQQRTPHEIKQTWILILGNTKNEMHIAQQKTILYRKQSKQRDWNEEKQQSQGQNQLSI